MWLCKHENVCILYWVSEFLLENIDNSIELIEKQDIKTNKSETAINRVHSNQQNKNVVVKPWRILRSILCQCHCLQ